MSDGAVAELASALSFLERKRQGGELSEQELRRWDELLSRLIALLSPPRATERRRHLRVPADLEVRFRMNGATITCAASEIGSGGLGLSGRLWIDEDQHIVVENLRQGVRDYPLALKARVVWKRDDEEAPAAGAGLVFVDVDPAAQRQLDSIFQGFLLAYLERLSNRTG